MGEASQDEALAIGEGIMGRHAEALAMPAGSERLASGKQTNVAGRKIGDSEGVILPKEVLERLNIQAGGTLAVIEEEGDLRWHRLAEAPGGVRAQDDDRARAHEEV